MNHLLNSAEWHFPGVFYEEKAREEQNKKKNKKKNKYEKQEENKNMMEKKLMNKCIAQNRKPITIL